VRCSLPFRAPYCQGSGSAREYGARGTRGNAGGVIPPRAAGRGDRAKRGGRASESQGCCRRETSSALYLFSFLNHPWRSNSRAPSTILRAIAVADKHHHSRGAPSPPSHAKPRPIVAKNRELEENKRGGASVYRCASSVSLNQPNAGTFVRLINKGSGTPTNAGSTRRTIGCGAALRGGSSVGVPPRLSPKRLVIPKAQLQAKVSWDVV
jgi:hypothetical protein